MYVWYTPHIVQTYAGKDIGMLTLTPDVATQVAAYLAAFDANMDVDPTAAQRQGAAYDALMNAGLTHDDVCDLVRDHIDAYFSKNWPGR